jgi:hypothetical protein
MVAMSNSLSERFDRFGRLHPRLMLWVTISLAVIVTLVLLGRSEDVAILYQGF